MGDQRFGVGVFVDDEVHGHVGPAAWSRSNSAWVNAFRMAISSAAVTASPPVTRTSMPAPDGRAVALRFSLDASRSFRGLRRQGVPSGVHRYGSRRTPTVRPVPTTVPCRSNSDTRDRVEQLAQPAPCGCFSTGAVQRGSQRAVLLGDGVVDRRHELGRVSGENRPTTLNPGSLVEEKHE